MLDRARRQSEHGFTLIEMLIVIIVLGLLVAIVLLSLGTFTGDSAIAACKADAKQVRTAETAFQIRNDSYTDIDTLVSDNYLQSAPSSDQYTISVDAGTGEVTSDLTGCP